MSLPPLPYWTFNSFAPTPHAGNQAAVVVFGVGDARAANATYLRLVARDFNYSETAFLVPHDTDGDVVKYGLRWFTPEKEVELCGHATLAAARVAFTLHPAATRAEFATLSGVLIATPEAAHALYSDIAISLPARALHDAPAVEAAALAGTGIDPSTVVGLATFASTYGGFSAIVELAPEVELASLKIAAKALAGPVPGLGIVTQQVPSESGERLRINSRVFAYNVGIDEDPVTGAAHAALAPYYASRASLPSSVATPLVIDALQVSARGGGMTVSLVDGRARLVGRVWETARGTLSSFELAEYTK
ncbi:hypothetical protein Q5752_001344 [Cryptotrichosporon argae]